MIRIQSPIDINSLSPIKTNQSYISLIQNTPQRQQTPQKKQYQKSPIKQQTDRSPMVKQIHHNKHLSQYNILNKQIEIQQKPKSQSPQIQQQIQKNIQQIMSNGQLQIFKQNNQQIVSPQNFTSKLLSNKIQQQLSQKYLKNTEQNQFNKQQNVEVKQQEKSFSPQKSLSQLVQNQNQLYSLQQQQIAQSNKLSNLILQNQQIQEEIDDYKLQMKQIKNQKSQKKNQNYEDQINDQIIQKIEIIMQKLQEKILEITQLKLVNKKQQQQINQYQHKAKNESLTRSISTQLLKDMLINQTKEQIEQKFKIFYEKQKYKNKI